MTAAEDPSRRLQRLQQILSDSKAALKSTTSAAADADSTDLHLGSVLLERIRRLISELTHEASADADELERQAMQLLLHEYATAVGLLRAAARSADQRVAGAAVPILETRQRIKRRDKRTKAAGRKKT